MDKKGFISITLAYYAVMRCGFQHHAPDPSAIYFIVEEETSIAELAKTKGWHYSRKYGWLCNLKHNWKLHHVPQ